MIIYRPHRGTLAESMSQAKNFPSEIEMIEHIVSE